MKIQVLKDDVVNKIAAGEVVERPVSVVRELVDNAVDSGAEEISVYLEDGGKRFIRVVDSGCGMKRDDALLAFERHATSKLSKEEHLKSIGTLGFRGEALSSIAAIAKVTLKTRVAENQIGTCVEIHGGRLVDVSEESAVVGTDISVRNLFFNTPARKKFLKMPATETRLIRKWLQHFSLAYPQIHFRLSVDGKEVLNLSKASSRLERGLRLFRGTMGKCTNEFQNYRLEGIVSHPSLASHSSGTFVFLVNGRLVSDRMMLRAVRDGYDSTLKSYEYPQGFLSLQVPYPDVDVNVHPQKSEVRFLSSKLIYSLVKDAVHDSVLAFRNSMQADASASPSYKSSATVSASPTSIDPPSFQTRLFSSAVEVNQNVSADSPAAQTIESEQFQNDAFRYSELKYLAQLFDCYLLFEHGGRFYVIDMHAAHERCNFNRIRNQYSSGPLEQQQLLVPVSINLGVGEAHKVLENNDLLAQFGFEVESFGEDTIVVRSAPALLPAGKVEQTVKEIAAYLPNDQELKLEMLNSRLQEMIDHLSARIACHASIRSGKKMAKEEVYSLLELLDKHEFSAACPHGRPVVVHFAENDIERWFGRDR